MKVWLIGLGLALCCAAHSGVYEFEKCKPGQLLGNWYSIAFATNCTWLSKYLDDTAMMVATISNTEDGEVKFSSSVPTPYGCFNMEVAFPKGEDGLYSCNTELGKGTLISIKTDCDTYSINTFKKERDDMIFIYVTLYARQKVVLPEVTQIYMNEVKKIGLKENHMVLFNADEVECTDGMK